MALAIPKYLPETGSPEYWALVNSPPVRVNAAASNDGLVNGSIANETGLMLGELNELLIYNAGVGKRGKAGSGTAELTPEELKSPKAVFDLALGA